MAQSTARAISQTTNSLVSQQEAARELLKRRRARSSLVAFTEYTLPTYEAAWHHALIAEKLEAVARGEIDRLMINMPPRHGKSELASRRFPAWFLGANPKQTIISASYNMDKAQEFGGEVRDIVRSAEYGALFPGVTLKEDTRAKGFWRTDAGGYYIAAGVGTSITGRGTVGPVALIDDPLKDRVEADSETTREAVKAWYSAVILSRFPRAIIVVQTRWHEDDLSGWLLDREKKGGDKWVKLELPAINEKGEALWPEFYPIATLKRTRDASMPRDWSALYQQRPSPEEGDYFKKGWFKRYNTSERPAHLSIYGTSDYATKKDGGDFTVHRVWGVDPSGDIWLLDGWAGQETTDVWIERKLDLVSKWKPLAWFGEAGVIQKAMEPALIRRSRERNVYARFEWIESSGAGNKMLRARGFQARAAMGTVHIPDNREGDEWIEQMIVFPTGKHDDEVDAAGILGRVLDEAHPAVIAKKQEDRPRDYGSNRRAAGNGWKTG